MAGLPDDFNEDDFEDYNPHPYLGGYDIVKTYGAPLPPSTAICYPISPSSIITSPVAPPVVSSPVDQPVVVPELPTPVISPLPEQPRSEPYPYQETYNPEPYRPDLFRSWPFSNSDYYTCKGKRGEVRDHDYWHQLMKGLDFLFGHSDGFGEKRVGTDVYGIPIYANKNTGTESLIVQVEETPVHKIEYHEDLNENWPSKYEETKEENIYSYDNESYNDYYHNNQHNNSSYQNTYQDWGYKNEDSYYAQEEELREDNNLITTPIYSYNQHYYEKPLNFEIEPNEKIWTQNLISHENYPSYNEKSYQSYEIESNEPYRYETLAPFNPSWSQNLNYYHNNLEGENIDSNQNYSMYNVEGNESSQDEYNQDSTYYYNNNKNNQNNQNWSNNDINYGDELSQKSNWVDHSYRLSDALFGPTHNYYAHNQ